MKFRIKSSVVKVNTQSAPALFDLVEQRFTTGRGFAVATINLDHLVKLRNSSAFLAAYLKQDFVVADGNPIVWLSRLAKTPYSTGE